MRQLKAMWLSNRDRENQRMEGDDSSSDQRTDFQVDRGDS